MEVRGRGSGRVRMWGKGEPKMEEQSGPDESDRLEERGEVVTAGRAETLCWWNLQTSLRFAGVMLRLIKSTLISQPVFRGELCLEWRDAMTSLLSIMIIKYNFCTTSCCWNILCAPGSTLQPACKDFLIIPSIKMQLFYLPPPVTLLIMQLRL